MTRPKISAESRAKVFVNANGWNILPSCACIAKTGRKEITVVAIPVITAELTSLTAERMVSSSALPRGHITSPVTGSRSSLCTCRTTFSMKTTPTSTITPMAMAIPDKATIFASTPQSFITMNVQSTARGSIVAMTTEARRLSTRMSTTMIQMRTSWVSELSKVPIVSLMS